MLSASKQGCVFYLPGAGDDARTNLERLVAIAEEEVGTSNRSSVRAREVRRVDVREQNHVTGVVDDGVGAVTGGVA